jgi:hypothetical protein
MGGAVSGRARGARDEGRGARDRVTAPPSLAFCQNRQEGLIVVSRTPRPASRVSRYGLSIFESTRATMSSLVTSSASAS